MKACTDLKQSKKLAEFLPIESADMMYHSVDNEYGIRVFVAISKVITNGFTNDDFYIDDIPCWSLAALMELMPPYLFEFERGIDLNIYRNLNGKGWHCSYMPNNIENMKKDKFKQITNGDTAIDAAFEMIVWLKENGKI